MSLSGIGYGSYAGTSTRIRPISLKNEPACGVDEIAVPEFVDRTPASIHDGLQLNASLGRLSRLQADLLPETATQELPQSRPAKSAAGSTTSPGITREWKRPPSASTAS